MRKILFILLLVPFALKSQTVNTFRDSTWFKRGVRFDSTLVFSKGAGVGKVWTSNANGTGSWQTFSSAGVTQGALNDSISSVRGLIPDVSSYATITNLKDSTALVRGLIPDVSVYATKTNLADTSLVLRGLITSSIPTFSLSKSTNRDSIVTIFNGTRTAVKDSSIVTPTFTLSKNSTRDSIVTTYNGTRSAVKDSSIVMPTFSFGRNASLDSIYAIYNGTRYSAKDSLPTTSATSTTTFTNKRITARIDSTTSSATPTINTDNVDTYKLTAQAADITSFTTNLSGTPTDDQILHIVIIGTASRVITWGAKFEASTVALPTTTSGTNRLDVYFIWNTATSKWRCGGVW